MEVYRYNPGDRQSTITSHSSLPGLPQKRKKKIKNESLFWRARNEQIDYIKSELDSYGAALGNKQCQTNFIAFAAMPNPRILSEAKQKSKIFLLCFWVSDLKLNGEKHLEELNNYYLIPLLQRRQLWSYVECGRWGWVLRACFHVDF